MGVLVMRPLPVCVPIRAPNGPSSLEPPRLQIVRWLLEERAEVNVPCLDGVLVRLLGIAVKELNVSFHTKRKGDTYTYIYICCMYIYIWQIIGFLGYGSLI